MRTDNELNRLIAERVMGWRVGKDANGKPAIWDAHGFSVKSPSNYCTDPAAWAALWDFLTAEGWHVTLDTFADRASADVRDWRKDRAASVHDNEKGRALVLATLAAYGVEVE